MTQPSQPSSTVIAFHGVQLTLPASLPFSHQDGFLILDFSLGYTGKLVIKPGSISALLLCKHMQSLPQLIWTAAVSDALAAASPTLYAAQTIQQPQHQGLATFHPSFSGQLSQHADLSQGSYPPWLLQSSNPSLCIPDSLGTQSPIQRQTNTGQDQPAAVSLYQQEAHKRNAAALQELMTQADASEPEADDFVTDTAADAGIEDADKAVASTPYKQDAAEAPETSAAVPNISSEAANALRAEHAALPAVPQDRAETGRGAGTPAGPQEEFYSPQEHFHSEPAEQHDSIMSDVGVPLTKVATDGAQQRAEAADEQQHTEAADVDQQAEATDAQIGDNVATGKHSAPQAMVIAEQALVAQRAESKTPLHTKTPANPKRRKGNKR